MTKDLLEGPPNVFVTPSMYYKHMGEWQKAKLEEQKLAREMRSQNMRVPDIAKALGVAKSSVSTWVRDVPYVPQPRRINPNRKPHPQQVARVNEIQEGITNGHKYFSKMTKEEFFAAGIALYAGEGSKNYGSAELANTNPKIIKFYVSWLREFFEIDESRLRVHLYLHEGLNLEEAYIYWSEMLDIPIGQFKKPYRAVADPSRKKSKHIYGCIKVRYSCSRTARKILGYMDGLLECYNFPG